jgi:DNA-binding beta-propeller fold protein YncE
VWRTASEEPTVIRNEVGGDRFDRFDVGVQPRDIAASGGDVWLVACGTPGTVVRLDAETGDVLATIPAGGAVCPYQYLATGNPISIAAGEGVWVTDALNGTISRISETTNQVDAPIRVGDIPTAVAVGLGSVWVIVDGTESPSPPTS